MSEKPPKHSVVIDPSNGTITEVLDYRGTQGLPNRPHSLDCDFCGRPSDRLWCRPVPAFQVEMWSDRRLAYDGGHWNACVFCEPMVAARDIPLLLARVQIINQTARGVPMGGYDRLYQAVFAAMGDAPVEWHSGDVFPIKAGVSR